MRRFVTSVVLFLFAIPFGVSVSGCKKTIAPIFCNNGDSGTIAGQITNITLQPIVYGISLNSGQIGQTQPPAATDCKGQNVNFPSYTYSTTDMTIADVNPANGHLCGGTWNRNTGGGIADYTYCNSTGKTGVAYIAASADGATSNPLPVFVHPVVTSIVLGSPSSNCSTDPTTACCPLATNNQITAIPYTATSCISQNQTAQLGARVYAGSTNISCQVGHLLFSAGNSSVVSIDQNGVATALQPGSSLIGANIANASSSAGFFSTCPPASIVLAAPGASGATPITVNQNSPLPLTATVLDTNNNPISGLTLTYVSTAPNIVPALGNTISPILAGSASISALCLPSSCNPSSYNQIGIFGNGKPITSNSINIVSPGTNSTILYMGSTQSKYIIARDFTQPNIGQPLQLPYLPNSMAISTDGATIFMGSSTALMVINATSFTLTRFDLSSPGLVIGVSPDGSTVVLTDPVKGTVTLEDSASGNIITTYGGIGTHAAFTPDNKTVYVTAGNQLLVFNSVTGWTSISPATTSNTPVTDVAITVPSVGAYFAGPVTTARGYCPATTIPPGATSATNVFYPPADTAAAITDRISATNDGEHIIGATVSPVPTLNDLRVQVAAGNTSGPNVSIACPTTGGLTLANTVNSAPLAITASSITGILPASDSSIAFVTYAGSSGLLPAYVPASSGLGALNYVHLSGTATAPLVGVFSSDNSTAYIGTSGDNLVHIITHTPLADSSTFSPGLVSPSGSPVPVDLMTQKPRKTT